MLIALKHLEIPPGHKLFLHDIPWDEFVTMVEELGEHRGVRLAFDHGMVEIMAPLPGHEWDKEIVSDLLKALLEELERDFGCFGSTTFKKPMAYGLEPDQCFYIQHEAAVRGKERLDLTIDPPPDLALEIDLTSRTHPEIYAALRVPELWRFVQGQLHIYVLQGEEYIEVQDSPTFPGIPLGAVIPTYLAQSKIDGRNPILRAFRRWVRQHIRSR